MDRRGFMACGLGACGCAMGIMAVPGVLRAEDATEPDQRLAFARYQLANLIRFMEAGMENPATSVSLIEKTGRECARLGQLPGRHKGDVDGYLAAIRQAWGTDSTYDKERGVITLMVADGECGCPLVDPKRTPAFWCHCSVGYQKEAFETITSRPVRVTLKGSKLSGSKRCTFEVELT